MDKTGEKNLFKSTYFAMAIFNIAKSNNVIDLVEDEMGQLKEQIINNLDLKKLLTDSSIKDTEKLRFALELLGEDASSPIKAFLSMLILMDAVEHIDQIYSDYIEITNQYKKQISIEVLSAIELDAGTIKAIKEDVDNKTGLDVRVKNIIDKGIIGGIVIKIGERVIDLSVKNKIDDLRSKLKALELRGEDFGIEN